jgi:hypothetical protein
LLIAAPLDPSLPPPAPQFEYEKAVAALALGDDADALGGLVAGGSSWIQFTDTQHCGKVRARPARGGGRGGAARKLPCWTCVLLVWKKTIIG